MDTAPQQYSQSAEKKKKDRNWTAQENSLFANLLADPQFGLAQSLESRAVKKQANEDLFQIIASEFDTLVNSEHFMAFNEAENFLTKDGRVLPYTTLDLDIRKLRCKYHTMKKMWINIGSTPDKNSLAFRKRPEWYDTLDPFFRQYRGKEFDKEDPNAGIGMESHVKDKNIMHAEIDNEVNSLALPVTPPVEEVLIGETQNGQGSHINLLVTEEQDTLTGEQETSSRTLGEWTASKQVYDFLVQNKKAKVDEATRRSISDSHNRMSQNRRYRKNLESQAKRPRLDNEFPSNSGHLKYNGESQVPYHFVETLRVIIDSHRQQQRMWMEMENKREQNLLEMENKREQNFLLREERSLAREKNFLSVFREEGERYRQHQLKFAEMYTNALTKLSSNQCGCKKCDSQTVIEEEYRRPLNHDAQNRPLIFTCNNEQTPDSQSCSVNDPKLLSVDNHIDS